MTLSYAKAVIPVNLGLICFLKHFSEKAKQKKTNRKKYSIILKKKQNIFTDMLRFCNLSPCYLSPYLISCKALWLLFFNLLTALLRQVLNKVLSSKVQHILTREKGLRYCLNFKYEL